MTRVCDRRTTGHLKHVRFGRIDDKRGDHGLEPIVALSDPSGEVPVDGVSLLVLACARPQPPKVSLDLRPHGVSYIDRQQEDEVVTSLSFEKAPNSLNTAGGSVLVGVANA